MKLLDTCENHHGPVTQESILLVDTLIEKELISEIGYLRATAAPDIRQMRRVKVDGKFKMMKFSCPVGYLVERWVRGCAAQIGYFSASQV